MENEITKKAIVFWISMFCIIFLLGLFIGSRNGTTEEAREVPVCVRREGGLTFCEVLEIEEPSRVYGIFVEMNESRIGYSYEADWE